ncbi:hypothetical protein CPIN17261_1331 [Campylobacter pinnipediorum subsp. pinnipediorum]|nr:hypothetical protein CPIN17260_0457 [Campylobacter pinnipediorum subsp. pinnipediorum]AQW83329.1 hypothetical protein CPIN17261_1331 [Campylobacter pinnipediorum subsp. pinnipediorum]
MFLKRAQSVLLNPDEITDDALDVAVGETLEECQGKSVKSWVMMDFAMIRLKVYLKIALSEEDIVMLKNARAEIGKSVLEGETKTDAYFNMQAV